jgi:ABC-2 type transport system permease protein
VTIQHEASLWRTFWANATMTPKTAIGFMRFDFILGSIFVIPLTQMVFFSTVASLAGNVTSSVSFVLLGNAVATVTYTSIFGLCQTTDQEKQQGTMEHLLVTPANRTAMYLGRGFVPILLSLATITVGLLYAAFLFHVSFAGANYPELAISIVLTCVSMVGFGLLLGGIALFLRTSIILGNVFLFIGLLLSGVNFPTSYLPLPLQWAGDLFPLTWGVSAIRDAIDGNSTAAILEVWGVLVLATFVALGLAMGLWGMFERRALTTGSIVRF